jgi:hypothetical protein
MPDGSKKKNYINLHMENFNLRECGDLQDMVEHMDSGGVDAILTARDDVPNL